MKQLIIKIIQIFFITLIFPGCRKIELSHSLTEKEKFLTAHGWRMSVVIENGIRHPQNSPWSLDDCWYFYPDGTFLSSAGEIGPPVTGGDGKPEDATGTWALVENETKLSYSLTYFNTILTRPIEIKADTMIFSEVTSTGNWLFIYTNCN